MVHPPADDVGTAQVVDQTRVRVDPLDFPPARPDPLQGLVKVLNRHGLHYVVIGGAAALVRDLPLPATVDLDVTPATDDANLL